jgi:ubiquinone/menaquinone biosynthesis C-methylase UbiE
MKHRDTSWEKVANWYDQHVTEVSDHHRDTIIPSVQKLLDIKKGEKLLDVGCGQGVLCRELASKGVKVVGIDASRKLIDIAKKRSEGQGIQYFVQDATKMDIFQDGTFDAVTSILAIQNMEDLGKVASGSARVLKKGGKLVWVLNHPCFRIPRQSGWGFDEKRKLQYRRVDRYMSDLKIPIKMHPGAAPDVVTWTFHRPLSEYFKVLNVLGLAVTGFEEWIYQRKSQPGGKARAENMSRSEIPLFLAIKSVKL